MYLVDSYVLNQLSQECQCPSVSGSHSSNLIGPHYLPSELCILYSSPLLSHFMSAVLGLCLALFRGARASLVVESGLQSVWV